MRSDKLQERSSMIGLLVTLVFLFSPFFVFAGVASSTVPDIVMCSNAGGGTTTLITTFLDWSDVNYWQAPGFSNLLNIDGTYNSGTGNGNCVGLTLQQLVDGGFTANFGGGGGSTTTISNSTTTQQFITAGTSTPLFVSDSNQDIFMGMVLFIISMAFVVWFFKRI